MKTFSFFLAVAGGTIAAAALASGCPAGLRAAAAATPPPTPPPIGSPSQATPMPNSSMVPTPSATLQPGPHATKPTPSPPPNARKGLDGVWEVALQHPTGTDYTHISIKQNGDTLTGVYLDAHGKKYPLAGSVEGQAVRLIVSMPNGTTLLLEGRLDGTTDMVGVLTMPDGQVPFTAAYRAKEKWIENVNPSPGGIPNQGGGYTPP